MKILIAPYAQKLRNGHRNPKNYPHFKGLIELLGEHNVIQVGRGDEKVIAKTKAFDLSLDNLKKLVSECDFWISVDSFLPHLANHVQKPGVVIFSLSDPNIFGYEQNLNILKDRKYIKQNQFGIWEESSYNNEAFLGPQEVYNIIKERFKV